MRERLEEALRETFAEFMSREANRTTLVTVTRAQLRENGKGATIYLSVYPESGEEAVLQFIKRNVREFGAFFESRVRGARLPHLNFEIDLGEKNRRRLDELEQ